MIAQLMNYKMCEYLSYGRQATLINKVCKVVKWLSGPYHLGEDLLGPQGYICLKRVIRFRHLKAVPMLKVDRFRGKKSKDNSRKKYVKSFTFFYFSDAWPGVYASMSPQD